MIIFKKDEMEIRRKLILIDANNLAYRAFYALPQTITTSTGQITNAVFGFTSMLLKLMEEQAPDMIICAFDSRGPTFRHDVYENYKATRKKMPDELAGQMLLIKEVAQSLNIQSLEVENYEADDIIATLARKLLDKFEKIIIVSGDKDILQLVNDSTTVMAVKKGITDIFIYNKDEVKNKFGVSPEQIRELLALTGDSSDNIPGASGIGPKTALDLLTQFKSVDEIYRNTDKIKSEKLRELLISQERSVRTSLELAVLHDNLNLDIENMADRDFGKSGYKKAEELFSLLEFNTLKKKLSSISGFYRGQNFGNAECKDKNKNGLKPLLSLTLHSGDVELSTLTDLQEKNVYVSILAPESDIPKSGFLKGKKFQKSDNGESLVITGNLKDYYIFNHSLLSDKTWRKGLEKLLADIHTTKSGYDFKQVFKLLKSYGIEIRGKIMDYKILYLLLNPVRPDADLKEILYELVKFDIEVTGMQDSELILQLLPHEKIIQCAAGDTGSTKQMELYFEKEKDSKKTETDLLPDLTGRGLKALLKIMTYFPEVERILSEKTSKEDLEKLYNEIESPLIEVLADMESRGVAIDLDYLGNLISQYDADIKELTGIIYNLCNASFNINSTQQLSRILFEDLKLSPAKKTKTGYSTDAGTLISIFHSHPVIEKILDYREKVKLKNTYLDVLPNLIDSMDGRVHTTYNQLGTTTGRISSNNPNLQNIPVRTELGKQIRKAFIPGKGYDLLLSADYSQIELRILAHLSGDDDLIEAFKTGFDIHSKTASEIFNIDYEKVDENLRRKAKAINFGIIYGMTEFGLKNRLAISEEEARQYIKLYFDRYPKVKNYINNLISTAYKTGYTRTMFGRKRYIKELASTNVNLRNLGERLAVNTPIQGSAADIMKFATVVLFAGIKKSNLDCNLILHVHDEIVLELKEKDLEAVTKIVADSMENCITLSTGLKVDIKTGKNWFI